MTEHKWFLALDIVLALAEVGFCWKLLYLTVFKNEKPGTRQKWIVVCSCLFLAGILGLNRQLLFFSWPLLIISILVHYFCVLFCGRRRRSPAGSIIIMYYAMVALLDFFFASVVALILKDDFISAVYISPDTGWSVLAFAGTRFLIACGIYYLSHKKEEINVSEEYHRILWGMAGLLFFLVIDYQLIMVNYALGSGGFEASTMGFTLLVTIAFIVVTLLLSFRNLDMQRENQYLSMREEMMMEKYRDLEQEMERSRILVHDEKHDILALKEYVDQRDYEGIQTYLDDMIQELSAGRREVWTQNRIWDLILHEKKKKAEAEGIRVDIQSGLIREFPFSEREGCLLFGNLMDNAIEACEKICGGERWIRLRIEKEKYMLFMEISNSIGESPRMKNGRPVTTKTGRGKHGYGLRSVERIVSEHNGTAVYHVEEKSFSVSMTFLNAGEQKHNSTRE